MDVIQLVIKSFWKKVEYHLGKPMQNLDQSVDG